MKRYHIEIALFLVLFFAFLYCGVILFTSIQPAAPIIHPTRNQWGQLPATMEELCNGTILQWSVRCTEIAHKRNRKDI